MKNRSFAFNSRGELYIIYLHVAHVFEEEKMQEDASLVCLCPIHHYYFDHPRGDTPDGVADWYFIGLVAKQMIENESRMSGQEVYV